MENKRFAFGVRLVAASLFAVSSVSAAQAADKVCGLDNGKKAAGKPIVVGAVVGKTGPADFSSAAAAARAYFRCVNENGGINGRPIDYRIEDDKWSPESRSPSLTPWSSKSPNFSLR